MQRPQSSFGIVFLVVVIAASLAASFEASAEVVQDLIICKSPGRIEDAPALASTKIVGTSVRPVGASVGKAVRMLRVYKTRDLGADGTSMEGCRATYSKSNVEQTVGSSRQREQCRSITAGIQKNLEASQWKCRTAQTANMMKSKAVLTSEANAEIVKPSSGSSIQ